MIYPIQDIGYVIDCGWILFILYWIIEARKAKRNEYRQSGWGRAGNLIFLVIFGTLAGSVFSSSLLIPYTRVTQIIGVVISFLGIAFAIWARVTLGSNWSGTPSIKKDHELITTGPYRIARHPIYTGIFFSFLGVAIAIHPGLLNFFFVICAGISMGYKLKFEERLMMQQFPEAYPAYKRRVRAALIPYIL